MAVLTTNLTTLLERLVPAKSRNSSLIKLNRSMNSRYTCLCCSNALLRHIYLGKLYWRCNHCYQAMPVMEKAGEVHRSLLTNSRFSTVDFQKLSMESAKF